MQHPKHEVLDYFREVASHPDPAVRKFCYEIGIEKGCPEFSSQAQQDLSNDLVPIEINGNGAEIHGICHYAQKYLDYFAKEGFSSEESKQVIRVANPRLQTR